MSVDQFLAPVGVGNDVYGITHSLGEAAVAAGFAAWVNSVTNDLPYVTDLGNGRAKVQFSPASIPVMRQWLDDQVRGAFTSGEPPTVEYDLGAVLNTWAVKYAVPSAVAIFLAGLLAGYLLRRFA